MDRREVNNRTISFFGKMGHFRSAFSSVRKCFTLCLGTSRPQECHQSNCWLHQSCKRKEPILCDFELNPCYDHFGLEIFRIRIKSLFPEDYRTIAPTSFLPSTERKTEMPSVYDCPVCFCEYSTDGNQTPCVLPCGHSVCLECSYKLCRLSGNRRKNSKCPFCRQSLPVQRSSSFSINYALLSILEHQDKLAEKENSHVENNQKRFSDIHVSFDDRPKKLSPPMAINERRRESMQSNCSSDFGSLPKNVTCRCVQVNESGDSSRRGSTDQATRDQKSRDFLPPIPPHEPLDERFIQAGESIPPQRQKLRGEQLS